MFLRRGQSKKDLRGEMAEDVDNHKREEYAAISVSGGASQKVMQAMLLKLPCL